MTNDKNDKNDDLILSDTDYSDAQNWLCFGGNSDKKTDIFVVYPTVVFSKNEVNIPFAQLKNETMRSAAQSWLSSIDDIISQANVYVPLYRQLNGVMLTKYPPREMWYHTNLTPRDDIFAAFDYYLTKINKNERPFILFGHSQGSQLVMELATTFLGNEKYQKYNKNHIVSYAIGSPFTQREIAKNPFLKFGEKKDDTRVIVSWNCATESEYSSKSYENFLSWKDDVLVINPVSWRVDEIPAKLNENVNARADIKHGILIVDEDETKFAKTPPAISKFHLSEIPFFADFIKQNVKDRINAFNLS
ncbi:MAG: DUF3089 domain-containing protein [Chitinivibrionia bacterium]|nr:DUF3089 domain-containing protein [Chitinivibrionia bacterium]MCL1946823.1 DUF3089 domain-containing protein [Chitinivibrionia bacterium]